MKKRIDTSEALSKIRKFYRKQKRLPSYKEITWLFGYKSKNAAWRLAQKLVKDGFFDKDDMGKLVPRHLMLPVMVLGEIQAGNPTFSDTQVIDAVSLDEFLVRNPEASFLLRVNGNSMIEAGIRPGDMVIVEHGKNPKNGDVVVAQVDGEWTLKHFEKKGNKVVLKPANKKFKPIIPKSELVIGGVAISVIRKYY